MTMLDCTGAARGSSPAPSRAAATSASATARHRAALVLAGLALSACSRTAPEPPTPSVTPAPDLTAPSTAGAGDASVPAAASVVRPVAGAKADAAAGRSLGAMSPAQQSAAMPLPGQNNDHSAPLPGAPRASGP